MYLAIKEDIEAGKYLEGSFLPTEQQLMDRFGVSRTTVRRAMELLKQDGLIQTDQGRGAEVLKGKRSLRSTEFHIAHKVIQVESVFLQEGKTGSSSSIIDIVQAEQNVETGLQAKPFEPVYRIQRLKFCGDTPFDFVASYVPCRLAPGLEAHSGQIFWLSKCLNDQYGITSTRVEERISAGTATFLEANLLHVAVGAPLLVIVRTAWNGEEIIEYTESRIRPDMFQVWLSMDGKPDYLNTSEEKAMEIASLL